MDFQNQRHAAARNCAAVLNDMREVRDANPDNFPGAILGQWPDDTVISGAGTLSGEAIRVNYTNVSANPLEVTVTSQWLDLRGRQVSMRVTTLLTNPDSPPRAHRGQAMVGMLLIQSLPYQE